MIIIKRHYSHPFLLLFTTVILLLLLPVSDAADNTSLVYKVCSDEKLHDPSGVYSQNLKSLLVSLVSQSSQKPFFTTNSGTGQNNMIMGLYQCRGDLSNTACYNCVSKVPYILDNLCGKVVAARIQLSDCYLRYEVVGYKQVPETQLLYKVCGSKQANGDGGDGFEEKRESAFGMVENGVKSSNGGKLFYKGSYQSLNVMGQCEGDLAIDDCGDCVKSAEEQAKAECGDSFQAQIYLHKCFLSYSFYPEGVSSTMPSSTAESAAQEGTQKTAAIALGIFAAIIFCCVVFLCVKSVMDKKRDGTWK
ncbi:plasmodesmata-located protein 3-like [Arachis stenosperma]|uniref:plasmodesmata-located protein 3-like n=1 Tax=Arachis stenosperma TaxID=217475 RepID=UPI0025ACAEBD|nr:plasmodesmata-located protein 3-like [Arachis stenosperma]